MPEDIVGVLKDILRGACHWRGVRISEFELNDSPPQLKMNIVNGVMESYRLALVFKIVSFQGSPLDVWARCFHQVDPYPHGRPIRYTFPDNLPDNPAMSDTIRETVEEIFERVERHVKCLYPQFF